MLYWNTAKDRFEEEIVDHCDFELIGIGCILTDQIRLIKIYLDPDGLVFKIYQVKAIDGDL